LDETNAAFTLNGITTKNKTLLFAKTDFQVLKLKFHACSMKQAFCPLCKLNVMQG